ncbi:MAG: hypothetical protein ACRDOO_07325 [Actinomadura sp.]
MALSRRVKITLAGAGVAGAAMVAAGGTAFAADPGVERTELQIVDRHDSGAAAPASAPKKDCPEKASPAAAQAADTR